MSAPFFSSLARRSGGSMSIQDFGCCQLGFGGDFPWCRGVEGLAAFDPGQGDLQSLD